MGNWVYPRFQNLSFRDVIKPPIKGVIGSLVFKNATFHHPRNGQKSQLLIVSATLTIIISGGKEAAAVRRGP